MTAGPDPLHQTLIACLEAATLPPAKLVLQPAASVDTETEATLVFAQLNRDAGHQGAINLRLLYDQLSQDTVIATCDIYGSPDPQLVVHGAVGSRNYKLVVGL